MVYFILKIIKSNFYFCGILLICFFFISCIFDPVATSTLDRLHKFQYISIDFNADIECNNEIISFSSLSVDNIQPFGSTQNWPLIWDGVSFTVSFDYDYELYSGERVHSYGTISGTLTEDGEMIETLTASSNSNYPEEGDMYKYFISVIDVPYNMEYAYDAYSPRFGSEGPDVINNIYSYSQSWDFTDSDGKAQSLYATTINYNDPDDIPYLHITFSGD